VWITEAGPRILPSHGITGAVAKNNLKFQLSLPNCSSRIKRFYLYQWKGSPDWDSGLIDYKTNKTRSLYGIYRDRSRWASKSCGTRYR
jgi:hypothetical protein